ncbi:bile acid:sodium symporter family protein [Novosphingobium sp. PC22D]|uniref:bile acid:sodium symporter family protein n=1 Tax=Novosphingobium sp. PC22D TaxID=1962403 RepID=UPI000BF181B9|nr:bile acid:sodium symporter family protein [Novosphingobium sp. PC22D]
MIQRATGLFAFWTVLGAAWAWFLPEHFVWVADGRFRPFGQPLISVLLGVVMLGMGITLDIEDFRRIARMPRAVAAGVALQFTVMPLAGLAMALAFGLETGLAVGLILVACCPGGTASNVIAYLARANVALSVTMTMVSTLVAIAVTPVLVGWLAGIYVSIDRASLFREMVAVVLVPVIAGVLLARYLPRFSREAAKVSPLVSVFAVVLIIAGIIARSKPLIEAHAGDLLGAVVGLHLFGFGLGWIVVRLIGFDQAAQRAIAIEVGMQNSGLGASLASSSAFRSQFVSPAQAALAPVPAALSAVCHVVIGSVLASIWARTVAREDSAGGAGSSADSSRREAQANP